MSSFKKPFIIFFYSSVGTQCRGVHFSRVFHPVNKHCDYIAALNQTIVKATEQVLIQTSKSSKSAMQITWIMSLCPDLAGSICPEGSAACLVSGKNSFDMGQPGHQLELLSNDKYGIIY